MGFLGRNKRQTKKSCIGNAVAGVVLAIFMLGCFFAGGEEYRDGLLFTAGLMLAASVYWMYRWYKFDDKDFNDPFHLEH